MATGDFLFYNGRLIKGKGPLISPDNRSFRYGDGCFETMKIADGKLQLADYHFERLFTSLDLLRFELPAYFTRSYLEENILAVAEKNKHATGARVRLTIARGDGGLYDPENHYPNHLIQTWAIDKAGNAFNENGLIMGVYQEARKVCDGFSHIKHNNYLPNVMAALWAKEHKLNDAILLNPDGRVADATIANVFIIKDGTILTPALSEGAINGVMRRYLLHCLHQADMPVKERTITVSDLLEASEVFLTNAVVGIKWVQQVEESRYTHELSTRLYQQFIVPLWQR